VRGGGGGLGLGGGGGLGLGLCVDRGASRNKLRVRCVTDKTTTS